MADPERLYQCHSCPRAYVNHESLVRHTKLECGKVPQFPSHQPGETRPHPPPDYTAHMNFGEKPSLYHRHLFSRPYGISADTAAAKAIPLSAVSQVLPSHGKLAATSTSRMWETAAQASPELEPACLHQTCCQLTTFKCINSMLSDKKILNQINGLDYNLPDHRTALFTKKPSYARLYNALPIDLKTIEEKKLKKDCIPGF
ncbi:hypothetical protein J6590_014709 [Homalodisca vitripennis]|nr:hypothetical protein J6590_014709 [Homalodisca vitripennis]